MKQCILILFLAGLMAYPVSAAVKHRYDFVADANDVVGDADAVLESGAVVQDGALVLAGGASPAARAVLDGPSIGINTYTEGASIEFWFSDNALSGWTRVFDFGDTSGSDGGHYWFYTPSGPGNSRVALSTGGFPGWSTGEQFVNGPALSSATTYHIVCVYDPAGGVNGNAAMRIYQDGVEVGANEEVTMLLSGVHNTYAYLGSAVYPGDPELNGRIEEFRIHDKPLNPAEALFTNFFGPDDAYPIVIRSAVPAYGAAGVSRTPTLSWTLEPDIEAASYNLYLGTDPNIADPNRTDVAVYSDLVKTGLTEPSYTVQAAEALTNDLDYYWRVDTVATDTTVTQGVGSMFTVISAFPSFTDQPDMVIVDAGETAVMTASFESISEVVSVQWFKVAAPDVEVIPGGDVTIDTAAVGDVTTTTLTIANVEAADEGAYYVKAANTRGPRDSASARLVIKGLVAYWPFEGNAADASGNGYDGTPVGPTAVPGYLAGMVGQAIDLDGTEDYIDLPDGFADFTSGLTFSVWAYPRTAANWARFMDLGNGAGVDNILFARVGTSATLRYDALTGAMDAANALALNEWQMFTVTHDLDGSVTVYKNGQSIGSGNLNLPTVVTRTSNFIGKSNWPDALYNGLLDEFQIYNYAMTPEEVAALYTEDTPEDDYLCVSDTEASLAADLNGDCRVDLADVTELLGWWMECERYPSDACSW